MLVIVSYFKTQIRKLKIQIQNLTIKPGLERFCRKFQVDLAGSKIQSFV